MTAVSAQQVKFKTYLDVSNDFSFDIPQNWLIRPDASLDASISICDSTTDDKITSYKFCAEGIIFRIESYNSALDVILTESGLYEKIAGEYVTSDRIRNDVGTERIKGKNWVGIYHNNTCGVMCVDEETNETSFYAAAGQCEFFYFANEKRTICISTNGVSLEDDVRIRLLGSFQFLE
jgi:hypothetical protein